MSTNENHMEAANGDDRNIHDETDSFIGLLEEKDLLADFSALSPEDARKRASDIANFANSEEKFDGKSKDYTIPSSKGAIPVTAYTPSSLGMKPAIVVYFHGVGLTWGSRQTVQTICQHISQKASCIIVNVEYRSPPEHKLHAAIEDGVCVVRWITFNKGLLGGKNDSCLGVMGDSGGGLIAAQIAQELAQITFQILVYPKLNLSVSSPSYSQKNNKGPLCTLDDTKQFIETATDKNQSAKVLERCEPGERTNCYNFPPALFVIAEYDLTKDDAHDYIKKLKECSVKTTTVSVKGTYHGFFHLPGIFKKCCEKAVSRVVDFIKGYSDYNHLQLLY